MISGIYSIRNLVNDHIYIGSSVNIESRWRSHKNQLKKNRHHSSKLQNAYNKYGKDNFIFEVISYIEDKTKLINYEQKWLDFFNPEYNILITAGSPLGTKMSDETRKKISESKKGKPSWNKGIKTGQIPTNSWKGKPSWNSGLTKETDDRIKQYGLNVSKTKKLKK